MEPRREAKEKALRFEGPGELGVPALVERIERERFLE